MPTFLRISLLLACGAAGVAIAIALAWQPARAIRAASPARAAARPVWPVQVRPVAHELAPKATNAGAGPELAPAIARPAPRSLEFVGMADQLEALGETLQQVQSANQRQQQNLTDTLSQLLGRMQPPPGAPAGSEPIPPPLAAPGVSPNAAPLPRPARVTRDEGDDKLTLNVQDSDIRQVLDLLAEQGGINILASKNVQGKVTASLTGVSVETALAAILRSTGFVARREAGIIYIGSPGDFDLMDQTQDRLLTRVYRPNYIKASDLQQLLTPILTPTIGKVTVSAAAEVDLPADQVKTGGNNFGANDVVIVRDYEAVLRQVDQIVLEVDVRPRQVSIEAMILSVKLSDSNKIGVNFEALRNKDNARLISGMPLADLGQINLNNGGLKFGFLDSSLALFIEALETIGDTNVIASPRLMCMNKQRAEIQIGEELGYVNTTVTENAATQSVSFLEVGTLLRLRPFIASDGMIRMEVHPELSTGNVSVEQGLTLPNKSVTQVTTNVMCPDTCTIVIGGLIREDLSTTTSQIPWLGSLPLVGPAFRQKTEKVDRVEIIVLITPRIVVDPQTCEEGKCLGNEFAQRQSVYFDKMNPLARRNYGLHYLRLARASYSAGDFETAMRQVNMAIQFDPLNRDAITLRNQIVEAGGFEPESIHEYLHQGLWPWERRIRDYSQDGYPWKDPPAFGPLPSQAPGYDPGPPPPAATLFRAPPPVRQVTDVP